MENWKAVREEDESAVDGIPPLQEDVPDEAPANDLKDEGAPERPKSLPTSDLTGEDQAEEEEDQSESEAEEEFTENEEAGESNEDEGEATTALEIIFKESSKKGGSASAQVTSLSQEQGQGRTSGDEKKRSQAHHEKLSLLTQPDPKEKDAILRNMKETATTLIEKDCAAEDVIKVWESLCRYITFKMMEGKAVRIAGLGTFTALLVKTPVNQKTVKVVKAPVFLLSEYVIKMYALQQEKAPTSNIPLVPLNKTVIAIDCSIAKGMVQGIITEVLQSFARGIVCNKSVELPFPSIGKLQIKDRQVKMRFYNEFCKKLGFNAAQLKLEKPLSSISAENIIPGRMTPLRLHIPSDQYRSVFHLREVRSVHETPLLVLLVQVGGKLVPATLAEDFKEEFLSISEEDPDEEEEEDGDLEGEETEFPEEEAEGEDVEELAEGRKRLGASVAKTGKMVTAKVKTPQPQTTGDCVLNMTNSPPDIMRGCLRSNLYRHFIETLGLDVVKSHLTRRPCPLDRDFPSYEDVVDIKNGARKNQMGYEEDGDIDMEWDLEWE